MEKLKRVVFISIPLHILQKTSAINLTSVLDFVHFPNVFHFN